eukprot:COSAG01_NODE_1568_length_9874_cov_15.549872_9_plen_313_part_00
MQPLILSICIRSCGITQALVTHACTRSRFSISSQVAAAYDTARRNWRSPATVRTCHSHSRQSMPRPLTMPPGHFFFSPSPVAEHTTQPAKSTVMCVRRCFASLPPRPPLSPRRSPGHARAPPLSRRARRRRGAGSAPCGTQPVSLASQTGGSTLRGAARGCDHITLTPTAYEPHPVARAAAAPAHPPGPRCGRVWTTPCRIQAPARRTRSRHSNHRCRRHQSPMVAAGPRPVPLPPACPSPRHGLHLARAAAVAGGPRAHGRARRAAAASPTVISPAHRPQNPHTQASMDVAAARPGVGVGLRAETSDTQIQ